jgi:hypothetical protein
MYVTLPKMTAAVLMAVTLAFSTAPARSAEPATADDTARFLAGLPPSPGSPLEALTKDPAWQQHARSLDAIFAREDSSTLSKVRAFSRDHLADKHDTMLYMFSGPDFLYATSFFPNASTYVLAGLEPPGPVPELTNLSHAAVDGALRNLEVSMGTLLSYSFFITIKMQTQLRSGPVYGTLPVLLVFMARTGKTVHEISLVSLDEHGDFQTPEEPAATSVNTKKAVKAAPRSAAPGAKIVFSDGNGPKQTLYYFSTNLSNGSFERSGFSAFLAKLGPADSFIKSASYLLHGGGFSNVRSFLLEHSATLLEDDSGVPLAYFDQKKWHLQPFGRYVGPLSIFGHAYQPGMAELYRRAAPLDFKIGYRFRRNESNLLLAQKGAPTTSDQELTPRLPADQYPAGTAARTPKKSRKRVESDSTGSVRCRVAGFFPFCSDSPPRPGR